VSQYTIKVAHRRGDKTVWQTLGVFFYNPPNETYPESIVADFNSLPALGTDCRAYPRDDDQEPAAPSAAQFTLSVGKAVGDQVYYHQVGTAFYNPPANGTPENWKIVLDSSPFTGKLRGFPHAPRNETDESPEGSARRGRSNDRAA
jgi:hypothetical protein